MRFDEHVVRRILRDAIAHSDSRLSRIALCRHGSVPIVVPDALPTAKSPAGVLWEGVLSLGSGADSTVLLARGCSVAVATVGKAAVLVAEFENHNKLGVAGVLVRRAADEILEHATLPAAGGETGAG